MQYWDSNTKSLLYPVHLCQYFLLFRKVAIWNEFSFSELLSCIFIGKYIEVQLRKLILKIFFIFVISSTKYGKLMYHNLFYRQINVTLQIICVWYIPIIYSTYNLLLCFVLVLRWKRYIRGAIFTLFILSFVLSKSTNLNPNISFISMIYDYTNYKLLCLFKFIYSRQIRL